jgi:hypothetical protein
MGFDDGCRCPCKRAIGARGAPGRNAESEKTNPNNEFKAKLALTTIQR